MRKRPEASGIRRTFRPVEGTGEGSSVPTGGLRGTSLPAAALPKEGTDKRPLSAHSVLNSITRHSSLKAKVESPQFRRGTPAGRSKSFSNHRPLEPEVFSQIDHSSQVRRRTNFHMQLQLLLPCAVLSSGEFKAVHRQEFRILFISKNDFRASGCEMITGSSVSHIR